MKAIIRFSITRDKDTRTWLLDLKNPPGSLKEEQQPSTKADCTLLLSDDNFQALVTGQKTAMSLFMGGQLKIQGNMMLAQRLSSVFQAVQKADAGSAGQKAAEATKKEQSGAATTDPVFQPVSLMITARRRHREDNLPLSHLFFSYNFSQASKVFREMQVRLAEHPQPPNNVFQFDLEAQGKKASWVLDGKARVITEGKKSQSGAPVECTLAMSQDDFLALVAGKTEAMALFMGGKLRISGNMMLAQKLKSVFQTAAKL